MNAFPGCQPFCARWTERMQGTIALVETYYDAYEGSLLVLELLLISLMEVTAVELGRDLDLDYAPPGTLRRVFAGLSTAISFMLFLYVIAVWAHLAPNPHTRRAVRLASRLCVMTGAFTETPAQRPGAVTPLPRRFFLRRTAYAVLVGMLRTSGYVPVFRCAECVSWSEVLSNAELDEEQYTWADVQSIYFVYPSLARYLMFVCGLPAVWMFVIMTLVLGQGIAFVFFKHIYVLSGGAQARGAYEVTSACTVLVYLVLMSVAVYHIKMRRVHQKHVITKFVAAWSVVTPLIIIAASSAGFYLPPHLAAHWVFVDSSEVLTTVTFNFATPMMLMWATVALTQYQERMEAADRTMAGMQQFTKWLFHQVRTPLGNILLASDDAHDILAGPQPLQDDTRAELRDLVATSASACRQTARLLDKVKELAGLRQPKHNLLRKPMNIIAIYSGVVEQHRRRAAALGVHMVVSGFVPFDQRLQKLPPQRPTACCTGTSSAYPAAEGGAGGGNREVASPLPCSAVDLEGGPIDALWVLVEQQNIVFAMNAMLENAIQYSLACEQGTPQVKVQLLELEPPIDVRKRKRSGPRLPAPDTWNMATFSTGNGEGEAGTTVGPVHRADSEEVVPHRVPVMGRQGSDTGAPGPAADPMPPAPPDQPRLSRSATEVGSSSSVEGGGVEGAPFTGPGSHASLRQFPRVARRWLTFRVTDNGAGMRQQDLEAVWKPFQFLPTSSGTGLSLTIARTMITRHSGTVSAASQGEGRGAEFSFTVPLTQIKPPGGAAQPAPAPAPALHDAPPPRLDQAAAQPAVTHSSSATSTTALPPPPPGPAAGDHARSISVPVPPPRSTAPLAPRWESLVGMDESDSMPSAAMARRHGTRRRHARPQRANTASDLLAPPRLAVCSAPGTAQAPGKALQGQPPGASAQVPTADPCSPRGRPPRAVSDSCAGPATAQLVMASLPEQADAKAAPTHQPEAQEQAAETDDGGQAGAVGESPPPKVTALVVDDVATTRKLLRRTLLRRCGVTDVVQAANGVEAVEAVSQAGVKGISVITMDVQMPVMNGLDACRAIRRMGYTGPIIGLTGNALMQDVHDLKCAGADKVCTKPVDPHVLRTAIQDLLFGGDDSPTRQASGSQE